MSIEESKGSTGDASPRETWRRRREAAAAAGWAGLRASRAYAAKLAQDAGRQLRDPRTRAASAALLGVAGLLFAFLIYWAVLVFQTPSVRGLRAYRPAEATIAYTADGRELTRYHFENRTWVGIDQVAESVVQALIATEDHRFYEHGGIDVWRMIGAVAETAGGDKQGGSTISMQLARNLYSDLRDDPILKRKFREWLTAARLEAWFSKEEILEMYLNTVPFMYDAYGIEAAARTYFQKPASELDLLESATLIGMLKATVYYNPVRNPERSHVRRNLVLQQMVKHGYLDPAVYERVRDQRTELRFLRLTHNNNRAPYFAEYVRQWLDAWAEEHGYNLYTDGLRVYTTLDTRLQEAAEASVRKVADDLQAVVDVEWSSRSPFFSTNAADFRSRQAHVTPFAYFWDTHPEVLGNLLRETDSYRRLVRRGLAPDEALQRLRQDSLLVDSLKADAQRLEAGFIALDRRTGAIRAWVGGRDFVQDQYDHAALAKRQPGSTFKPFVYAAALENGYAPYNLVPDRVVHYVDPYTGVSWSPGNFGGVSGRFMTLGQGLAYSKNTITSRLILQVGADKVARLAKRMGIKSDLLAVPSLALGTSEVTLLEMAGAYGTLANQGVYREPTFITRIEDRHGNVVATFAPEAEQVVAPHVAYAVLDMMRGVTLFGTGVRIRSMFGAEGDLAGKTGTTQNAADGWFMLMHPDLVMGAWVGFNRPSLSFRTQYWGQGAHNALHVVGEFYQKVRQAAPELLDPEVTFEPAEDYAWGSGIRTETDRLTRSERESNKLDQYLRRLRRAKGH